MHREINEKQNNQKLAQLWTIRTTSGKLRKLSLTRRQYANILEVYKCSNIWKD